VQRARIVLLASKGMQSKDIAAELGIGRVQVSRWRERYAQARLPGIERDLPRGAPPVTVDVARLVELTTQGKPTAATHWSTRTMAAELGVSAASISRYWRKNGLKPIGAWLQGLARSEVVEKLETSWACTCRRPNTRWCCAAMRRAKCRRWTARSPGCR